jgi:hypothetical protein
LDTEKYGWVLGLLGLLIAAVREAWGAIRHSNSEVKRDEITFLTLRVDDVEKKHAVCEMRCEELREDVMTLLSHIHDISEPPKRRRKRADAA